MERNNTSFQYKLTELLNNLTYKDEETILKYYQFLTTSALDLDIVDSKGLLIKYEMGLGKTFTSLIGSLAFLRKGYRVVVISPKSLRENFISSIDKINSLDPSYNLKKDDFSFVNLSQTINKQVDEALDPYLKLVKKAVGPVSEKKNLGKTLFIIDEAHNLFRLIANGSPTAVDFYNRFMDSDDAALIALTGTPINSHPFEFVPAFNMLHKGKTPLFPEDIEYFEEYFIDGDKAKNLEFFTNRIFGLCSWADISDPEDFPEELPKKLVHVPMSREEYGEYLISRQKEKPKSNVRNTAAYTQFKSGSISGLGSFRVETRQKSNYAFYKKNDLEIVESTKIAKAVEIINSHSNQIGLLFSEFVGEGGLIPVKKYLKQSGYDMSKVRVIDGSISDAERDLIMREITSPENKNGELISICLLGKTGIEGLDFKNIRYLIMLEPYWTPSREEQFKKRGIRYKSHVLLPKDQRNAQLYVMIAVPPDPSFEKTTDEHVYKTSQERKLLNDQFLKAVKSVSIESSVLNDDGKLCNPTNSKLFRNSNIDSDLEKDIADGNPCQQYKEVEVTTIEYEGKKYPTDGKDIYEESVNEGFYKKIDPNSILYKVLAKKLN